MKKEIKRKIYLFCASYLGVLLGFISYALLERMYILSSLSEGIMPVAVWGECGFLSPWIIFLFLALGAAFGFIVGIRWWRIVYVEKRHWLNRKKKKQVHRRSH